MRNDLAGEMAFHLNEQLERLNIENAITTLLLKGYAPRVIEAHLTDAFDRAGKIRASWKQSVDRRVSNV